MNQEIGFETMPFELAPEFQNEAFELEESERGRLRGFSGKQHHPFLHPIVETMLTRPS